MNMPRVAASTKTALITRPFTARLSGMDQAYVARKMPLMRKYQIASLAPDGTSRQSQHIAPATPLFESAFSAFARGTLISTTNGPCAIEDLMPGDIVQTTQGVDRPVIWIGSMTLIPNTPADDPAQSRMTRVLADSLGFARPMGDFVGGPGARILQRAALGTANDTAQELVPLREMSDGVSIFDVSPPTPVLVYHLCLDRHATINAAGLAVGTYHPGNSAFDRTGSNLQALFLSLFPHIDNIGDFGPMAYPHALIDPHDSRSAA